MGEIFYRRLFFFILIMCGLFFVVKFIDNNNGSSDVSSNYIALDNNLISGYAVHPLYNSFSSAESGFTFNNNSNFVSVSDTAVYSVGYYSVNGGAWQSFNLAGTLYASGSSWLTGSSSATLPSFGVGEHYVIIYSCTYSSSWDCHGDRWQLIVINNTVSSSPSCSDGTKNGDETSTDCGGSCGPCSTYLRTFYVSNSGNDSKDGLSPSTAWKTISKVNNQTFSPDDAILFRRGDTWRETLTLPSSGNANSYVIFSNYGLGNRPRILGSMKAIDWTETAQGSHIWKSSSTLSNPYVSATGNIFFIKTNLSVIRGIPKTYTSNFANLAAEYDWTWNTNTLYVYSLNNPDSEYSSIEASQRDNAIYMNGKQYIEINGIDMFYAQQSGVMETYPTGNLKGYILRNCEIAYLGTEDGYGYGSHVLYSNSLFENNVIHDVGRRGISLYNYGTYDVGNIIVQNNTFYNGYHITGVDCAAGSILSASGDIFNVTLRNNLFYEQENGYSSSPAMVAFYGAINGGAGVVYNVSIYNNIFKYVGGSGIQIWADSDNINIFNNVFYGFNKVNTGGLFFIMFSGVLSGKNIFVKNNIFYNDANYDTTNYPVDIYANTMDPLILNNINYNLHYTVDSRAYIAENYGFGPSVLYRSSQFSAMNSTWGWEKNSPAPANPLFVDPLNNNFNLRAGSVAIRNGINVGLITDYAGNNYAAPPSIGAFEYTGVIQQPVPNCSDGIKNQDETGIDCGGICSACSQYLRTFYVSNSGNDNNNGTDQNHPWKTITKVNSYAFRAGDAILFKRGDTWTGTTAIRVSYSGNLTYQITYGAYGTGAKPVFNFLSSLSGWNTAGNWIQTATGSNIWYKSVSNDKRYRLWLSGTEVKRHIDASVNATEPWYLADQGTTLYVYSITNPATAFTNIQAIEAENVFRASSSNADYITIQNLDIQGAYYAINFGGTLGWIIENCSIGWNSNVAIHSWPGYLGATRSFTGDVIIRNNILDSGDRFVDSYMWNNEYECISQRDGANNWNIYNNTILDWTHGGLALYEATTGYVHINVKYHDNFISSKDIDYGYALVYNAKPNLGACYGNEVYNNYIYSSGTVAIQINGDGIKIYNNIIDTVRANAYQDITTASGIVMQSYSGLDSDNLIYNNVFTNCYYAGIYIKYFRAETKRNVIANNIFYNNGLYDLRYEYSGDNGASIGSNTIKNNLFYKSGSNIRIFYEKMAGSSAQPMTVATFNAQNGITTNLQSGEVADVITGNIYGNPLFVDGDSSNYLLRNYHLRFGSPAIGNGTNVGLLTDYEGNAYTNPPSIGVYR